MQVRVQWCRDKTVLVDGEKRKSDRANSCLTAHQHKIGYLVPLQVTSRDVPNIRFVFASVLNSSPNSVFVFGRIVSSERIRIVSLYMYSAASYV